MGISFTNGAGQQNKPKARRKARSTLPVAPAVPLDQPGRLRVCNLMAVLGLSRASVYARMGDGRLPAPDGHDGRPYWNTSTVRAYLSAGAVDLRP